MEKKKVTKKVSKKTNKKPVTKKVEKKKKGFTLIELLAVIIILGILMIIAIPSVTRYINDSRKSAYVDTAKEIVSGTRNLVNEGKLGMYDTTATYYIPADYINTENALKSPYGEFSQAYVGVVYDGKGYKYSWISCDDAGQGVDDVTALEDLDTDDIKSDLNSDDILSIVKTTGINGKNNIYILTNGTWEGPYQAERAPGDAINSNSESHVIQIVTEGKTKDNLSLGDEILAGGEPFNVIKVSGDNIILLAKYNLYVGGIFANGVNNKTGEISESDPNYLKQSNQALGYGDLPIVGTVPFAGEEYWEDTNSYAYVYDSSKNAAPEYQPGTGYCYTPNYSIAYYVNQYENYLRNAGVEFSEIRLLTRDELKNDIGCTIDSCRNLNANQQFITNTSFWLGTATYYHQVGYVRRNGDIIYGWLGYSGYYGVRPVIVISKSSI